MTNVHSTLANVAPLRPSASLMGQDQELPSARALRHVVRDQERESSRLRIVQSALSKLASEPVLDAVLGEILALCLQYTTTQSGMVLRLEQGQLHVVSSRGDALPIGARLNAQGALHKALQNGLCVRERVVSRLCVSQPPFVALELLIGIQLRGQMLGVLGVLSKHQQPVPDPADWTTLQTLASIAGAAFNQQPPQRHGESGHRPEQRLLLLTPREQQVLALLPRGLSNSQLANELQIAAGTVKSHIERILHKLSIRDRTQAAVLAVQWGLSS